MDEEDWTNVPSQEELWLRRSHLVRMRDIPKKILELHIEGARSVSVGSYYRQDACSKSGKFFLVHGIFSDNRFQK